MNERLRVIEPTEIGPYKFFGVVGDGAFSIVKLVRHIQTNEYFACKIVPKSRINTPNLEERFQIEIRINQQLHHPGIVEFVDLLKDENNYYVIMEFCPNGELFQFIVDHQRLAEGDSKPLLRQILETIQYLHTMGVSHRDLKPENLLLDQFGRIKISDFGLSRFFGSDFLVNTPCGSPCYASPECVSGNPYNGITTDVWSVGVIFYAMLTGQLPWTKRNQAQLFEQIKKGEYTIPSFLSKDAQSLLAGLMTVDPTKRLTIEQALEHPFMISTPVQFPPACIVPYHVSLKAVDDYFGNNIDLSDVDACLSFLTESSRRLSVGKTIRMISDQKGLPALSSKSKKAGHKVKVANVHKSIVHQAPEAAIRKKIQMRSNIENSPSRAKMPTLKRPRPISSLAK